MFNQDPWWKTDNYDDDTATGPLGLNDESLWGPKGPAMVQLFKTGKTSRNWGVETFMDSYNKYHFGSRAILAAYSRNHSDYAWVMRGSVMVVIDIDGKNGGFDGVAKLGLLPPTTAEISMSGNGNHLFYLTEDTWEPTREGFGMYADVIGLAPGVDFRGTGCVYHKHGQKWNGRQPALLPKAVQVMLEEHAMRKTSAVAKIKSIVATQDDDEILIMHEELKVELAKDIPQGKRNNSLFALGTKMKLADVDDWEALIEARAVEVGLDGTEIDKLLRNIERYGV